MGEIGGKIIPYIEDLGFSTHLLSFTELRVGSFGKHLQEANVLPLLCYYALAEQ